jgi:uncharacterized protein (DUF1330 family)
MRDWRETMPAYMIARINVTDPEQYKSYIAATPGVIEKFGGKFIARGGETITLEGPEETRRMVVVEFPALENARNFYNSSDYREVMKLREGAAEVHIIAIAGV